MTSPAGGSRPSLDLTVDAVDLIGRVGSHRRIHREVTAPERADGGPAEGSVAMTVPAGGVIAVDADLESIVEGIYVGGSVQARLTGECSRCLDPVEQVVDARIDEVFAYPGKGGADDEDAPILTGDTIDLGPLVHDALAVAAEDRPLCRPDCPGLCPQCGMRMEEDPDHAHEVRDPRWAALEGLFDDGPNAEGSVSGSSSADRPTGER